MSIFERIDGVLKLLDVPFYDRMPTFAENEEPSLYIVYTLYDRPAMRGDGVLEAIEYTVTVNVIGVDTGEVDEVQSKTLSLFEEYDFLYIGTDYRSDSEFPQRIRRIMDFMTIIESEEDSYDENE